MGLIGGLLKLGAVIAVLVAVMVGMLTTGKLADLGFFEKVAPVDLIGAFPAALSAAELANAWKYTDMVTLFYSIRIVSLLPSLNLSYPLLPSLTPSLLSNLRVLIG